VAELGAAFLCADIAITDAPRADHAQYLANWLAVLKDDKRALFHAAAKAAEACAYLRSLQPQIT
jgi:antirestriction protein ArdC